MQQAIAERKPCLSAQKKRLRLHAIARSRNQYPPKGGRTRPALGLKNSDFKDWPHEKRHTKRRGHTY